MKYLKEFIVGSSLLVFFPFFIGFHKLKKQETSYFNYSLLAPLWFGVWNVISLYIAIYFNLSIKKRFLLISLITYSIIISYATYNKVYDFTKKEWYIYYFGMLILYLFVWNIIIYNIEKLIS
tara:strand:- start:804 stop:1169 length:366 start_codon:yes stop_codon:yes gene_type:complete